MRNSVPEPILNERHESRENFLKLDRARLCKRLEDTDDRLTSAKNTLQFILSSNSDSFTELSKRTILEYLIEEKSVMSRRLNKLELENEEALLKSAEQKSRVNEVLEREDTVVAELSNKYRTVIKDSKEKEETIQMLVVKSETANKEFKDLAKNRLNSAITPKNIPELLKAKAATITRVISKVREYSTYLELTNKDLQVNISLYYSELSKLNAFSKYPQKIPSSLEDLKNPPMRNLVQGDIREKVMKNFEFAGNESKTPGKLSVLKRAQNRLEEKLIKFESLWNELKIGETINCALKEDKSNLVNTIAHVHQRNGEKVVTYKPGFIDSFCPGHKRVISNPLDYFSDHYYAPAKNSTTLKPEFDLEISKDLCEFSSVQDDNYEVAGDSIMDDILCLNLK